MKLFRRFYFVMLIALFTVLSFSYVIQWKLTNDYSQHLPVLTHLNNQKTLLQRINLLLFSESASFKAVPDSVLTEMTLNNFRIETIGKSIFIDPTEKDYFKSNFGNAKKSYQQLFDFLEEYNKIRNKSKLPIATLNRLSEEFLNSNQVLFSQFNFQLSKDVGLISQLDLMFNVFAIVLSLLLVIVIGRPALRRLKFEYEKLNEFEEAVSVATLTIFTEEDGSILEANDNFIKKYGLTKGQTKGFNLLENQRSNNDPLTTNQAWYSCQKGNVWRGEVRGASTDRHTFYTDRTIIPLKSETASRFGKMRFFIIESDITDRKTYQNELETKNTQLQEYAFVTSHKVRAPLTSILGLINLIEKQYDVIDGGEGIVEKLKSASNELDSVVKELNNLVSLRELKNSSINFVAEASSLKRPESIILIDDDKIVNFINRKIIQNTDPNVKLQDFNEADKALMFLKEHPEAAPDIILLDINMPVMNGWEFLDSFVKLNVRSVVYMLSSSIDPSDRLKASQYDCVRNFISKPLTADSIQNILKEGV